MKRILLPICLILLAASGAWAYYIANITAASSLLPPELVSSNSITTNVIPTPEAGLYPAEQNITCAAGQTIAVAMEVALVGQTISLTVQKDAGWIVSCPAAVGPIMEMNYQIVVLLITAPRKAGAGNIVVTATNGTGASDSATIRLEAK